MTRGREDRSRDLSRAGDGEDRHRLGGGRGDLQENQRTPVRDSVEGMAGIIRARLVVVTIALVVFVRDSVDLDACTLQIAMEGRGQPNGQQQEGGESGKARHEGGKIARRGA